MQFTSGTSISLVLLVPKPGLQGLVKAILLPSARQCQESYEQPNTLRWCNSEACLFPQTSPLLSDKVKRMHSSHVVWVELETKTFAQTLFPKSSPLRSSSFIQQMFTDTSVHSPGDARMSESENSRALKEFSF